MTKLSFISISAAFLFAISAFADPSLVVGANEISTEIERTSHMFNLVIHVERHDYRVPYSNLSEAAEHMAKINKVIEEAQRHQNLIAVNPALLEGNRVTSMIGGGGIPIPVGALAPENAFRLQ